MNADELIRARECHAAAVKLAPENGVYWEAFSALHHEPTPVFIASDSEPAAATEPAAGIEAAAATGPAPPASARIALGLVSMTKHPLELATWLQYHRDVVQVERFYLKVEDTPELAGLLESPPAAHTVPRFLIT